MLGPPFSPHIREHVSLSDNHLNVQLKNTGTTLWNVVLRMVLENNSGLRLETRPNAVQTSYALVPGRELQLTGSMLKAHFDPNNLLFRGLSAADYNRGPLPNGIYKIRFDAYDATTGNLIAAGEPAQVWLVLNQAPLIVLPENNDDLYLGENRRFYFEWLPRHDIVTGISRVEYEFRMVQVPQSFTGQVASVFHTLPVVFRRTVSTPSLLIDFAQSPLERGRRYAFQVRARAMSGGREVKIFENDGYSPVSVFTYKGICPSPVVSSINFPSIHTAEIRWTHPPDITRYTFLIREAESRTWDRKDLIQPHLKLSSLDYGKTYEYRIRGYCKSYPGAYSETYTFMLPGEKPMTYRSRIRLTENAMIRYNHSDTTVTIADRVARDSIRVDVRETVRRNVPVLIVDEEGNMFTLTPRRSN